MTDARCAKCGEPLEDASAWLVTIDTENLKMTARLTTDLDNLQQFARALRPVGVVTASPWVEEHEC